MKKIKLYILIFLCYQFSNSAEIYFPPLVGSTWESISPESLNWNVNKIPDLYTFLDSKNTKAFIVLKDGKIVLEKYFDSFTKDSLWYWASAGKTLTSLTVGIAQEEGFLKLSDISSKHLGKGWTSEPIEKENLITIRHQLTMTSGLNDKVKDSYCTDVECLQYIEDAGSRWAYHNAPYTLLDKVITNATKQDFKDYFTAKIRNKIGMNGIWIKQDFNNIYISNARSMARYGILIQNNCVWKNDTILHDLSYIHDMSNTSQDLNKSYGYLWWLNGKEMYMIPQLQLKFPGMLFPDAPSDVFAALGKNGQYLNISPSKGIVMVRMGEAPSSEQLEVATTFNNEIWKYLTEVINSTNSVEESLNYNHLISPNPASDNLTVINNYCDIQIMNNLGETVLYLNGSTNETLEIDLSKIPIGVYFAKIGEKSIKFIKN